MNRHERRAIARNSPLYQTAKDVDAIAARILAGNATLRDIRTLSEFEMQLRILQDQLHPLNSDGQDRVMAMIIEINDLLLDARESSVVRG